MKNRIAVAALLALVAYASFASLPALAASPAPPAPVATAVATATPNPAIVARVKEWIGRLQSGKIDRAQLTQQMNDGLTPAKVTDLSNKFGPFGAPTKFFQAAVQDKNGNTSYEFSVAFTNGSTCMFILVVDDATNKISGLQIAPAD